MINSEKTKKRKQNLKPDQQNQASTKRSLKSLSKQRLIYKLWKKSKQDKSSSTQSKQHSIEQKFQQLQKQWSNLISKSSDFMMFKYKSKGENGIVKKIVPHSKIILGDIINNKPLPLTSSYRSSSTSEIIQQNKKVNMQKKDIKQKFDIKEKKQIKYNHEIEFLLKTQKFENQSSIISPISKQINKQKLTNRYKNVNHYEVKKISQSLYKLFIEIPRKVIYNSNDIKQISQRSKEKRKNSNNVLPEDDFKSPKDSQREKKQRKNKITVIGNISKKTNIKSFLQKPLF